MCEKAVAPAEVGHKKGLIIRLICPLLSAGNVNYDWCKGVRCAWYDTKAKCCAIKIIAWET